jgi:putative N6-adenine-specific DNA methylase
MKLIAKTLYGLEEILAEELLRLGAQNINVLNRAVSFEGDTAMIYRTNYCCRTALSILMQIAGFQIKSAGDLYTNIKKIEWDSFLSPGDTFSVVPVVNSNIFHHTGYAGLVLKDAVADWFRRRCGKRPSVNTMDPTIIINLHISNERVNVSVDSSGVPLYKRGYRKNQTVAPLNEVLAAGIVMLSGWDAVNPLLDPMCGSGTIPVEAALIACKIQPGQFRKNFGFQKWKEYDEELFNRIRKVYESQITVPLVTISARDISVKAVMQTRQNVNNAGLSDVIKVEVQDFQYLKAIENEGYIVMNPPYGNRIKTVEADKFYNMIGTTFKHNFPGYNAWLITSNKEALRNIGLKPHRKITLFNGALECVLVNYRMYSGSR